MRAAVTASAMVLAAGCATGRPAAPITAVAELRNAQDRVVGMAALSQLADGVRIVLEVRDLPPGPKAVHVHEVGKCSPPDFASAGAHVNPTSRKHGLLSPDGPHAGDLPNITIDPDGTGRLETTTDRIALGTGPTSLLDADGSALVVHAGPDDHLTDPAGGSGPRIVCGVIVRK